MKKILSRILAIVMIVAMAFAIAACGKGEGDNKAEHIIFTRGEVTGNTYTSSYMGLTITVPESWIFASDEEIAALIGYTSDFLKDPSKFEEMSEGELMDCYVTSQDQTKNMSVSFVKGSLLTDLDASVKYSIDSIIEIYESSGFEVEATKPVTVQLVDKTFKKVELTEVINGTNVKQYVYFALFNDYLVNISCTSADYEPWTAEDFEALFS